MKSHHRDIPTIEKIKNDIYPEHINVNVCGIGKNPYEVEWIRFEERAI